MEIKNVEVYGFRAAFRGMRNALNSWDRSDSSFNDYRHPFCYPMKNGRAITTLERPNLGEKDLKLASSLVKAGSSHRKFLRQIIIWVDFTLPRYVLTELDTYKVGTVRNSCSTMHTINKRLLTKEDFEDENIFDSTLYELNVLIEQIKLNRQLRQEGNSEFFNLKSNLPEGFLQLSTFSFSYETALNIYQQRKNHRLPQWNTKKNNNNKYSLCKFIEDLPYAKELLLVADKDNNKKEKGE